MLERTQVGLQAAREQGRIGAGKSVMTEAKIRSARKLLSQGTPPWAGQSEGTSRLIAFSADGFFGT